MKLAEAIRYAKSLREAAVNRRPQKKAEHDKTAMELLLDEARRVSITNIEKSRELLCLSDWVASTPTLRRIHSLAVKEPALALKCSSCGSDQDAWGGSCYECKNVDSCVSCDSCPECSSMEWVRPQSSEVLVGGKWENAERCLLCGKPILRGPVNFVDNLRPARGSAHAKCANDKKLLGRWLAKQRKAKAKS